MASTLMRSCLDEPNALLGNIEGAHRVHGWPTPLRILNASLSDGAVFPIAALNDIGDPNPYVRDVLSNAIADTGFWEVHHPDELLRFSTSPFSTSGGKQTLATAPTPRTMLDIGAQIGFYSLSFARLGYRVVAIEPMHQNVLALQASCCLNPDFGRRITVIQTAAVSQSHQHGRSCAVYSPFKANDVGNGKLECVNKSGAMQCSRRHNGMTVPANFTYFFVRRRLPQSRII